jgi:hypothetical protein
MSDLLKEAIADAKAVRETALQNAKMALEEAFTPHLKSMLSAKLAEDDDEYDDEDSAVDIDIDADGQDEAEMAPSPEDFEDEEDAEEMARYEEEGDEEMGDEEEGVIEVNGVKYAPIVSEEEEEGEEEPELDTEELDLEAVIKELENEIAESEDSDDDLTEDNEELDEYTGTKAEKRQKAGGREAHTNEEVDEEIVTEEDEEEEEKDKTDEQSTSSGIGKGTGVKQASASDEEDPGKGKVHEQVETLQSELNEYKEAVTFLRDKLHEVNILNAKLLYTNRLFREFALSNDQKLKIVETFDRAQTTREIKLVYSTLAESYKDGGSVKKNEVVKEFASRKSGGTAPKTKIISEESQVANRFKKLAGILND